ncbi:SDR family NAD(P)-dependent oxidoreductase [Epibacterium sp. SM1979]|uniref:SDR family NAD(P)-dependent oxidoreductase n=1 Tax=Tritonibacter litoralis TaxID=2662264 RepID=A0A843YLW4_9RHOB|nr:SDR family oxidoreductase [Tritonibacter litoralis]MQQ09657.1 SDR family NAD(P)-dependent oxidoreductase [Tritonibacter litoralis]
MTYPIDLSGKTALITGASRGIGAATARHLATLGANVVLAARSADTVKAIAAEIGPQALGLGCDVADWHQAEAAVAQTQERFGSLDIVLNNAGLIDPIARIQDADPVAWGQVVDVNVKGAFHILRAAVPVMIAQQAGLVINVSSGAATSALEGWSHYCATKAALLSLTRTAHKELGPKGVNIIGLSPGTVATDMQRAIKSSGINPVSQLDWEAHIPADWVAQAVAWLTTDAARAYDGTDFSLKTDEGRKAVGLPLT